MAPKAIIFDLFGTLVPPWPSSATPELARIMSETLAVKESDFLAAWSADFAGRMTGPIEESFMRVCVAMGVTVGPNHDAFQRANVARLETTRRHLAAPRADAVATLRLLMRRGVATALISDCSSEVPVVWPETA